MIALFGGPLSRIERVALVLGLGISATLIWFARDAVVDDTFVWLTVARHLAQGAGLVLNPGERVYTTVNPLWVTLLADGMAVGLDGLTLARALGGLATLLTVPLFLQLLRRTVRTPALRAIGTLAWASQAWMARWAMSGLETPLAVALVLGGFVALTEGADWGERPVRTGALWALAALTRPGAVLLVGLWGTALLIDAQNRPGLRRLVFGMLPPIAIYGSWLLFSRLYFGTFWPAVLGTAPQVNPTFGEWWHRVSVDVIRVAATESALLVAGVLALAFGRAPAKRRDRVALRLLPVAWVVLLPSLFAARGLPLNARHLLLVLPIVQWLVWWAVDRTWSGERHEAHAWMRASFIGVIVALFVVGQNVAVFRNEVLSGARQQERAESRQLVAWGRWLGAHARPGSTVAATEFGPLAYYGRMRVIDLNGLFTPSLAPARRGMTERELVPRLGFEREGRAEYVVDRGRGARELLAASPHAGAFEPLDESRGLVLYRVHWDAVAADTAAARDTTTMP